MPRKKKKYTYSKDHIPKNKKQNKNYKNKRKLNEYRGDKEIEIDVELEKNFETSSYNQKNEYEYFNIINFSLHLV